MQKVKIRFVSKEWERKKIEIDALEWYDADKRGIVVVTKEDIPKSNCERSNVILESSSFKLFESSNPDFDNVIILKDEKNNRKAML